MLQPADTLTPRPLSWLWPARLPLGKLAILDGDPGLGKSLLLLDLCARLSAGRAFPDGAASPGPANVICLNAEDSLDDTVIPRLRALGADLSRVFVQPLADDPIAAPLRFPADIAALEQMLAKTAAKLLILDPVVAFLDPSVHIASDSNVRRALAALARLAEKYQCSIILVRHFNKSGRLNALYRGGGSIGFVAACRTGWLVATDPFNPSRRVLAQVKNNCGPLQPSLIFELSTHKPVENQPAVLLTWHTAPHPFTANQLLASAGQGPAFDSNIARAADFLTGFLDDGPKLAREIWLAAEKADLTERTLRRAKKNLDIHSERVVIDRTHKSYWLLPGQELPATIPKESIIPSLEPWLAPLRERFPPSTPLDND